MSRLIASILAAAALALGGCATVSTDVVLLDPHVRLAPSHSVEILFEKPQRPHREIALLESRGMVGDGEVALLESARSRAQTLGADAIVRLEVAAAVQPPYAVYDPVFSPFYSRAHPYGFFYPPFYTDVRVIPGGTVYTLKSLAIQYAPAPSQSRQ